MLNKLTEWDNVKLSESETTVKDFYEKLGWEVKIVPVVFQRYTCADLYLIKGTKEKLVEIKADDRCRSTGNVFIETLIIRESGRNSPGWYSKLPAHLFSNFATCPHIIAWLIGDMLMEVHSEELIELVKSQTWKERETKGSYRARGYLVPLSEVKSLLHTTEYCIYE